MARRMNTDNKPLGVIDPSLRGGVVSLEDSVGRSTRDRAKAFVRDRIAPFLEVGPIFPTKPSHAAPMKKAMQHEASREFFMPVYGCMLPGGFDRTLFLDDMADMMAEKGFDPMETMRVLAELAAIGAES